MKKQWSQFPGNLDVLNMRLLFPSSSPYGIPDLDACHAIPINLIRYTEKEKAKSGDALHFYLDDFRFERIWKRPLQTLSPIENVGLTLTPDFSVYSNWPKAAQIWNIYRSHWMGAYWSANGIKVIPNVTWTTPASYDFVFDGMPKGSVLALSTVGIDKRNSEHVLLFIQGYQYMCHLLRPEALLIYGEWLPDEVMNIVPVIRYPSEWAKNRGNLNN